MRLFIVLLLSFVSLYAEEVTDYNWNPCWTLPLKNTDLFCYGVVTWPISESVFRRHEELDQLAKRDYQVLMEKWEKEGSTSKNPTNDCLAISRDFFCAYYIPKCGDAERLEEPLCTFYCDLFDL